MKCNNLIARENGKNIYCGDMMIGKIRKCSHCQLTKIDVVILDDNELSLALYAEEYPENWKAMTDSQKTSTTSTAQDDEEITKIPYFPVKPTAQNG